MKKSDKLNELSTMALNHYIDEKFINRLFYNGRFMFVLEFLLTKGLAEELTFEFLNCTDVQIYLDPPSITAAIFEMESKGIKNPYAIKGKEALAVYLYCINNPSLKKDWIDYASSNILERYWPFNDIKDNDEP